MSSKKQENLTKVSIDAVSVGHVNSFLFRLKVRLTGCPSRAYERKTAPLKRRGHICIKSGDDVDTLNFIFYWVGVITTILFLALAFLWSVGKVGIEKMTEEEFAAEIKARKNDPTK
jgi:hypothetical protein